MGSSYRRRPDPVCRQMSPTGTSSASTSRSRSIDNQRPLYKIVKEETDLSLERGTNEEPGTSIFNFYWYALRKEALINKAAKILSSHV